VREIDQLVLVAETWGVEPFEYDPNAGLRTSRALVTRMPRIREGACENPAWLARLDAGAEFGTPVTDRQRGEFGPFIEQWLPACLEAIKARRNEGWEVPMAQGVSATMRRSESGHITSLCSC